MTKAQLINELNTKELYEGIENYLGIKGLDFKEKKEPKKGRLRFDAELPLDKVGIFALAMEKAEVGNFSNGITTDKNGDLYYWVDVHFSYQFKDGGSNGCKTGLCAFYKKEDNEYKWTFEIK